jgi:hypothetical protein
VVGGYVLFWYGVRGRQVCSFLVGVSSYVPFWKRVRGRQLCAFPVGGWWYSDMCPSGRGLVVGGYVPFW